MIRALAAGAVCFIMGCAAAVRLSQRTAALRRMHAALAQMETYCQCLRMPPDEIVAAAMGFLNARNRHELMQQTERLPFTAEEKQLVFSACDALYDTSREAQVRYVSFAAKRFEELLCAAAEKQSRDAKLYASLGFLVGLCLILMCM